MGRNQSVSSQPASASSPVSYILRYYIQPITGYDKKKFEPLFIKNGHRPDIEKDFDL